MTAIYKSEEGARRIQERYTEVLKSWPVAMQQFCVTTRQGETFVAVSGEKQAPPLLLFHGSAANSAMWIRDVSLWASHFRVYAVDVIGEPGFSAPSRPPLDSEAYALWLDDVLEALSIPRASVVGISLGGWLALDYATRRPERVASLVLLCPSGIGPQKVSIVFRIIALRMCGNWGARKLRESILGRAPSHTPSAARPLMELLSLIHQNFRPRLTKLPIFPDDALKQLTIPVMAILGGKDVFLDSAATRRRLERNVAGADIRYLPEVGHLISGQSMPILDFLRRSPTA